jgi:hypothetical protein
MGVEFLRRTFSNSSRASLRQAFDSSLRQAQADSAAMIDKNALILSAKNLHF